MQPGEAKFREIEKLLDEAMSRATSQLESFQIDAEDKSIRTYHYKASYLSWEKLFSREWDHDIQTALVQVRLLYSEPINPDDLPQIYICRNVDKYRQGQVSSFKENKESNIPLNSLLEAGIDAVVLDQFKIGAGLVNHVL